MPKSHLWVFCVYWQSTATNVLNAFAKKLPLFQWLLTGVLHNPNGKTTVSEILNNQLTSVFTNENEDKFAHTVLEGPSIPSISDITVNKAGISKMLQNLNVKKACGPDYLSCRLLK